MLQIEKNLEYIEIKGYLKEFSNFEIFSSLSGATLKCDFSKLVSLNSIGLIEFLGFLKESRKRFEFHNCPELLLQQLDLFGSELPSNIRIVSIKADFTCLNCGATKPLSVRLKDLSKLNQLDVRENVLCSNCGQISDFETADLYTFALMEDGKLISPFNDKSE